MNLWEAIRHIATRLVLGAGVIAILFMIVMAGIAVIAAYPQVIGAIIAGSATVALCYAMGHALLGS
jgi:hypothetical protein